MDKEEAKDLKAQRKELLKAQYKTILRVTGLMLCCAVLFLSGFYMGVRRAFPASSPENGTITSWTYSPPEGPTSGLGATAGTGDSSETLPDPAETVPVVANPSLTAEPAEVTRAGVLSSLKWPVDGKISGEPGWIDIASDGSSMPASTAGGTSRVEAQVWKYYPGVDITCDSGSTVVAALPGTVIGVETDPVLGAVVIVEHEAGIVTKYGRVQGETPKVGERLEQGEAIGKGGSGGIYFSIAASDEEDALSTRECLATAR